MKESHPMPNVECASCKRKIEKCECRDPVPVFAGPLSGVLTFDHTPGEAKRASRKMKVDAKAGPLIISTTLLGPGRGEECVKAIQSARMVGILDHLIIPWGATGEDMDIVDQNGVRLAAILPIKDFSTARNLALRLAAAHGAQWAITLDTDERLHGDPWPSMKEGVDVVSACNPSEGYSKPRIFRLPAKGRWRGPTHEVYVGDNVTVNDAPGLTFSETLKTPERLVEKAKRDVRLLMPEFDLTNDPRWAFYLGESFAILAASVPQEANPISCPHGGRNYYLHSAIQSYRNCASLRDTPTWNNFREEGGWAMFKAARVLSELTPRGSLFGTDVLDLLIEGMRVCPWMAELPYLAAHLETEEPRRRLAWAKMAIGLGRVEGIDIPRAGFYEGRALYEAPYDLAGIAYKEMGDEDRATQMFTYAHTAKAFREKRGE